MSTKFITRTLAIWIGNILHQENWNQIRAQPEVATVKTPKNTLSFYFGMKSSAAIFDLNLRPLIIPNCTYLGCSPDNVKRFGHDSRSAAWLKSTQWSTKKWRNTKSLDIRMRWEWMILLHCTNNFCNGVIYLIRPEQYISPFFFFFFLNIIGIFRHYELYAFPNWYGCGFFLMISDMGFRFVFLGFDGLWVNSTCL